MTATRKKVEREESKLTGLDYSILLILVVVFSCTYDYFYYWGLGFSLSEIPSTLSDHYRSSLECMPPLIVLLIVYILVEPFLKFRIFFKKLNRKINRKIYGYFNKKKPKKKNPDNNGVALYVLILSLDTMIFAVTKVQFYPAVCIFVFSIGTVCIWRSLYDLIFSKYHLRYSVFTSKQTKFFNIIFSLFIYFAVSGYCNSWADVLMTVYDMKKTIEYSQDGRTVRIGILKNLEKGIFGVNIKADKAEFYTWEELKKVTYIDPKGQYGTKTKNPEKIEHKQPEKK